MIKLLILIFLQLNMFLIDVRLKQFVVKPSKYSMDIYKSVEIIILKVTKNPEMLQFASHQFKTKIICKYAVKGFIFRNKI